MSLQKLSRIIIVLCLIGLVVLVALTGYSATQIRSYLYGMASIVSVRERIDDFSVATDTIALQGADSQLWAVYVAEATSIMSQLEKLGEKHPDALKAHGHVGDMVNSLSLGRSVSATEHSDGAPTNAQDPLLLAPHRLIIAQQVARQGINLDTTLDNALREHQQEITQNVVRLGAVLGTSTLAFAMLCVSGFGLLHRRVSQPAMSMSNTLEQVRAGHRSARAEIIGNDEMARLASSLNSALDERDQADTALRQKEEHLRLALEKIERQSSLLDVAGKLARFGAWSVDVASNQVEWSDVVARIHGKGKDFSPAAKDALSFYVPEHREEIRMLYRTCAEQGTPFDGNFQIVDEQGHNRWVRVVGEAMRDEHDKIVRVQGAFQDIDSQKQLESLTSRLTMQLAAMLEAITDGFAALNYDWQFTYVNTEAARLLGTTTDAMLGSTIWSLIPEADDSVFGHSLRKTMHDRVSSTVEACFEPLGMLFDVRSYPWEGGIAFFIHDVTDTHRMLEQLTIQEKTLRDYSNDLGHALATRKAMINSLPAHIAMLNESGVIVDVNEQWRQFGEQNGYKDSDYGIGRNYVALCQRAEGVSSEEAAAVAEGLSDVLAGKAETFALEYSCHSPEEERWFRVIFCELKPEQGTAQGAVAMHIDITERKLAEREIQRLAFEDALTGALSRFGFVHELNAVIKKNGWPEDGIVIMADVVNQHDINDAYGYSVGDQVLITLSRRLNAIGDCQTIVGRTGGDEFVVFLPGSPHHDSAALSESLLDAVQQPFDLEGEDIAIGIDLSLGYTVITDHQCSVEELIREAELALFEHRRMASVGISSMAYSHKLLEQTQLRVQVTNELLHALEHDEFELHFQPKVNIKDGRVISAEALIRWRHPTRGLLSPDHFIPIAEQSQLIGPIGDWVLRETCRQLQDWQQNDLQAVRVAVNVSQIQFMLGNFSEKVSAALKEHSVRPEHLSMEITESVFERESARLLQEMHKLHDIGVRLSLDDFGTGYSSLVYLQRYPFDEVKIDRAFVDNMLDDRFSHEIVLAVMQLARSLDAEVVAEGIESAEVADALLTLGCGIGQGYYYSMPLESEDFRWLLQQKSCLPLKSPKV